MRLLRRNTTEFEYLPYSGTETDLNDDGEHTGEFHPVYSDPITYRGDISSPSGRVSQMFYGMEVRYTHTLVMDRTDTEIRENGVIRWKGELYDVQAVRSTLNGLGVALRKRSPDAEEIEPEEETEPEPEQEPEGDEP